MGFVIFIIIAVIIAVLLVYNVLWRSKDKKASLFFQMNGEGREDNLGKMTPSALEGLEEARKEETDED